MTESLGGTGVVWTYSILPSISQLYRNLAGRSLVPYGIQRFNNGIVSSKDLPTLLPILPMH